MRGFSIHAAKKSSSEAADSEADNEAAGQQSGGQGADRGARIQRVDVGIGKAVEGHGGRARGDHGYADPAEGAQGRNPVGGNHGAGESKGKREEGMLPLDHIESYANIMKRLAQHRRKPRHRVIVSAACKVLHLAAAGVILITR